MSLTDTRLYENNAKSTLLVGLELSSLVITLQQGGGGRFPAISSDDQYFLVTLENAGEYEVCKVTSRSGDSLTVERAQEGTVARVFPRGTLVQMRVTKGILEGFARLTDRLADIDSLDLIPKVSEAKGNSFLTKTVDESGNPIIATKANDRWRFPTHSIVAMTSVITGGTSTSITAVGLNALDVQPGRFIVNFLSGPAAGIPRLITSRVDTTISWDTTLSPVPQSGDGFELLVSNSYQISLVNNAIDESIINAIIFGTE